MRTETHRNLFTIGLSFAVALVGLLVTIPASEASLVAYYKLDGDATATVGANGSLEGTGGANAAGPVATTGRHGDAGGALAFDGTDDFINIGTIDDDQTEQITISAWAKLVDLNGDYALGSNRQSTPTSRRQFFIWMDFEGGGKGYRSSASFTTTTDSANNAIAGQWQHVVAVFDSNAGTHRLYIDGKYNLGVGDTVPLSSEIDNFVIGAQSEGPGGTSLQKFMNGSIDDFGVFDEAISAAKVSAIHGLSVFSEIDLDDAAIDAVLALTAPGQFVSGVGVHNHTWAFSDGLTGVTGDIGGSVSGGDAYIVLDGSAGEGIVLATAAIPTPAALPVGLCLLVGTSLLRRRRKV